MTAVLARGDKEPDQPSSPQTASTVLGLIESLCKPQALGLTRDGHPRHPLYVPYEAELVPFTGTEKATQMRCTDESQVPSIVMTASRRVRLGAQRGRAGDRLRGDAVTGARRQQ